MVIPKWVFVSTSDVPYWGLLPKEFFLQTKQLAECLPLDYTNIFLTLTAYPK